MVKYLLAGLIISSSVFAAEYQVTSQQISKGNRFQAIAINNGEIWISGTNSAVYKSLDGGKTWQIIKTPDTNKKLQYRDIEVMNDKVVLLSAGEGSDSRIYYSANQGEDWLLASYGANLKTFYDCTTVVGNEIWLYGDSIDGEFFVLHSENQGKSWQKQKLPFSAEEHEGGFAASGTCISNDKKGNIAIGTGNNAAPRILLKAKDQNWQSVKSPLSGGASAGIFSLQFDDDSLYAFGGTLASKDNPALAYVYDLKSNQWQPLPKLPLKGAIYGSAINQDSVFVSSPDGIAVWSKGSNVWNLVSKLDIWAMECTEQACWGVGANDTLVKLTKK